MDLEMGLSVNDIAENEEISKRELVEFMKKNNIKAPSHIKEFITQYLLWTFLGSLLIVILALIGSIFLPLK